MFNRLRFLSTSVMAITLATTLSLSAQEEPTAATVVAKVGETEITLGHMLALRSGLPPHYNQLPDEVLFQGVLDQLIHQTLLMQIVGDNPSALTRLMIENERRAMIASEAIRDVAEMPIEEEDLQAAYDERFAGQAPETEYHAAHILVASEEEASDIIGQLEDGADFGELAKTLSTGPSGPNEGDLGWFGAGVMVEPFFEAVEALEDGKVSSPVQTQFGWHVIKLIESRSKDIPDLETMREALVEELRDEALQDLIRQQEAQTEIDRSGADGINRSVIKSNDILEN